MTVDMCKIPFPPRECSICITNTWYRICLRCYVNMILSATVIFWGFTLTGKWIIYFGHVWMPNLNILLCHQFSVLPTNPPASNASGLIFYSWCSTVACDHKPLVENADAIVVWMPHSSLSVYIYASVRYLNYIEFIPRWGFLHSHTIPLSFFFSGLNQRVSIFENNLL